MNHQEIKHLQDEVLDLRRKIAEISSYGQEKDRMLCTIAVLVDRLGGSAEVGPEDIGFIQGWNAGNIRLRVEQTPQTNNYIVFTVEKGDYHGSTPDNGTSRPDIPGAGS